MVPFGSSIVPGARTMGLLTAGDQTVPFGSSIVPGARTAGLTLTYGCSLGSVAGWTTAPPSTPIPHRVSNPMDHTVLHR